MSFTGSFRALSKNNDLSGTESYLVKGTLLPVQVTLTYPLIATNVSNDQTTTISGASIGDQVIVGAPVLVAGLMFCAFVSAANTVTVRISNATAGSITPGALLFNITVVKP